ncbi:hypothetical protein [Pseudomonas fluorescens]|uniref:Uncharacterized protein n=2 Tax=Pseudomonas fluorescens TaxID=294 RepID=A0ABY1TCD6_PSEFL|nr:hypothetical protein [Pseudomonas fluorescens]MCI4604729.1 hypothetical protein [Pseudomonas fluorescens]PQA98799.1 hypothetical protein B0A76_21350 [Pseudomonas fluorescens]TWR44196.1 hypothetical protein FIP59_24490 [Pseudomonas fluorescens]UKJ69792.1 hypothetical protein H1Q68_04640 [Pseudomonas fluorescens]SNY10193.1 hypothetical protein SAMN04488487_3140 [Pseudomonas fluorescens]
MSSIGSSSFSPAMQLDVTGASPSNENQIKSLTEILEEKKKKKDDEEEGGKGPLIRGSDGAIYQMEGKSKFLVLPPPPAADQITF